MSIKIRLIFILFILWPAVVTLAELDEDNYNNYKGFNPGIADEHPVEFIRRFAILMQTYDERLIDLYSDDAKILAYSKIDNGLEKYSELTGEEWKKAKSVQFAWLGAPSIK